MTVAALACSTVVSAQPVDKDISVTAEVNGAITMKKSNGDALNNISLEYNYTDNNGMYEYSENVTIESNTGAKVNIKLRSPLVLEGDASGEIKTFDDVVVRLGRIDLNEAGKTFALDASNQINSALTIKAKKPAEALSGETYTGTLQLAIEDEV
ncbi:pilus assembly protein [Yersinia rohdei]|nr:pilus assembly protein [Yersinia rohdei]